MERSAVILFSREQRGCSLGRYFRLRGQPLVSMFGHIGAAAQRCASSPRGRLSLPARCALAGASPGRATRLRRGFAWPCGAPSPELRLAARCALAGASPGRAVRPRRASPGRAVRPRRGFAWPRGAPSPELRLAARCAFAGASPGRAVRPRRASPARAAPLHPMASASGQIALAHVFSLWPLPMPGSAGGSRSRSACLPAARPAYWSRAPRAHSPLRAAAKRRLSTRKASKALRRAAGR